MDSDRVLYRLPKIYFVDYQTMIETTPRFDTEKHTQDFERPVRHRSMGLASKSIRRDDHHSDLRRSSYPAQIPKSSRYPPSNKSHLSPASVSSMKAQMAARHRAVSSETSINPAGLARSASSQIPTNVNTISERPWDQVDQAPKRRRLTTEVRSNIPRATPRANHTQEIATSRITVEPEVRNIVATQLDVVAEALRTGSLVNPEEVEDLRAENRILKQRLEVCRAVLGNRLPKAGMDPIYSSSEVNDFSSGPWPTGKQKSPSDVETTNYFGSRARTQSSSPEFRPNNLITSYFNDNPHHTRSRAKKDTQLPPSFEYQDHSNESTLVGGSFPPSNHTSAASAPNVGRRKWYNLSDSAEPLGNPEIGIADFSDEEDISPQSLREKQSHRHSFVEVIIPSNQSKADSTFKNKDAMEIEDDFSRAAADEEASSDILQHDEAPSMRQFQEERLINNDKASAKDEAEPSAGAVMPDTVAPDVAQAYTGFSDFEIDIEAAKARSSTRIQGAQKKGSKTRSTRKTIKRAEISKPLANKTQDSTTSNLSHPPEANHNLPNIGTINIDPEILTSSSSLAALNDISQESTKSNSQVRQISTRRSRFRSSTSKSQNSSKSQNLPVGSVSCTPVTGSTTTLSEPKRLSSNHADVSSSSPISASQAASTSRVLRNRSTRTAPLVTGASSSDPTKPSSASTSTPRVTTNLPKSNVNHPSNPLPKPDYTIVSSSQLDLPPASQPQTKPDIPNADTQEEPAEKAKEVERARDEEAKRRHIVDQLERDLNSNSTSTRASVSFSDHEDPQPENTKPTTTQKAAVAVPTYQLRQRQTRTRKQSAKPGRTRGKGEGEKRTVGKGKSRQKEKESEREREREKLVNAVKELQDIDEPGPDPESEHPVDNTHQALGSEGAMVAAA
ncbi:MAG: hypothetical protein Q9160_003763 [Pyrenula sp. 1 TL-2023]